MKTSRKDFDLFVEQSWYWIRRMGLLQWEYAFQHSRTDLDSRAEVERNFTGKIATITLDPNWGEDTVSHQRICQTAFHEVCEVKYADIARLMTQFYSEELIEQMVHELIRNDEHAVFAPYYAEKFGE
jgi:hypothetical protein